MCPLFLMFFITGFLNGKYQMSDHGQKTLALLFRAGRLVLNLNTEEPLLLGSENQINILKKRDANLTKKKRSVPHTTHGPTHKKQCPHLPLTVVC
jgi:hypothetical protein